MADGWLGISSAEYDSECGYYGSYSVVNALDGTAVWVHTVNEIHWFILDLGQTYTIKKVRGRSLRDGGDPTDINIYIDNSNPPTTLVKEGITTWQDTNQWVEIVLTTEGTGRYIKVEIEDTEHVSNYIYFGGSPAFAIFDAYGDVAGGTAYTQTVSDKIGLKDSLSNIRGFYKTTTDKIGLKDTESNIKLATQTVNDYIGLVDTVTRLTSKVITDKIGFKDTVSNIKAATQTITDKIGLLDSITNVKQATQTITDIIGLTDSIVKLTSKTLSDKIGLLETITKLTSKTLTDELGLKDSISKLTSKTVTDILGLLDSITTLRETFIKFPVKIYQDKFAKYYRIKQELDKYYKIYQDKFAKYYRIKQELDKYYKIYQDLKKYYEITEEK